MCFLQNKKGAMKGCKPAVTKHNSTTISSSLPVFVVAQRNKLPGRQKCFGRHSPVAARNRDKVLVKKLPQRGKGVVCILHQTFCSVVNQSQKKHVYVHPKTDVFTYGRAHFRSEAVIRTKF